MVIVVDKAPNLHRVRPVLLGTSKVVFDLCYKDDFFHRLRAVTLKHGFLTSKIPVAFLVPFFSVRLDLLEVFGPGVLHDLCEKVLKCGTR